jgi:hypothetical protein
MNIYAFPLPGDPVIRPETRDEMIDRMAAEAMAEIREMANAARRALGVDDWTLFQKTTRAIDASGLHPAVNQGMWRDYGMRAIQDLLNDPQRAAMLQNVAYQPMCGSTLSALFNAFPRTA